MEILESRTGMVSSTVSFALSMNGEEAEEKSGELRKQPMIKTTIKVIPVIINCRDVIRRLNFLIMALSSKGSADSSGSILMSGTSADI